MIEEIRIQNWKRHEDIKLDFGKGINFVVGPNGSGKTAILDAIAFALLGDLSASAMYKKLTFHDLMRDRKQDLSIDLTFSGPQGGAYQVVRSFSPEANRKQGVLRSGGSVISRSWDGVTEEISRIHGSSKAFLGRIILLSEGETFEYSTMPSGEGLLGHVERVLAIDKLDDLHDSLDALRRKYTREASDWRAILGPIEAGEEARPAQLGDLEEQLAQARAQQKKFREKIGDKERELADLKNQIKGSTTRIDEIRTLAEAWKSRLVISIEEYKFSESSKELRSSQELILNDLEAARGSTRDRATWLSAQIDTQNQILSLVRGLDGESKDQPDCPVCRRPLTQQMIDEIVERSEGVIQELEDQQELEHQKVKEVESSISDVRANLEILSELDAELTRLEETSPSILDEKVLKTSLDEYSIKQREIEQELEESQSQLAEADLVISESERTIGGLEGPGVSGDLARTYASATRTNKAMYLSELFKTAVDDVLAEQRRELLLPLTDGLSKTWSSFLGSDVEVELGGGAQLLVKEKGVEEGLQFPALSGGEKTALLIFTHVFLSDYFSNCDFILLDEPLEHLDARNRWALMRFLVDAAKAGNPEQLIVTTVEEPLIREYVDDSDVLIKVVNSYRRIPV